MIVEKVGAAVVLRSSSDPAAALTAMAGALRPEPGRLAMVSAPSVTGGEDFFELIEHAIEEHAIEGIRLLMLGSIPAAAALSGRVRSLAHKTRREIVAPLGPLLVAADGTLCAQGGWLVCPRDGHALSQEPAWFPLPAWASGRPETAARGGRLRAQQVPAGYWLLPEGLGAGASGVAAAITPDYEVAAVFAGGHGSQPSPPSEVAKAARDLPCVERAELILLPKALHPKGSVAKLRKLVPARVVGGVPMRSQDGWGIARIGPSGGVLWRPPTPARIKPQALPGRMAATRRLQIGDPGKGSRTPAGWSFVDGAAPIGHVPSLAGPIVEIGAGSSGLAVQELAELIRGCGFDCPIVVVCHGGVPGDHLFRALADALGMPVTAADAEVSLTYSGRLHTSGRFRTWLPGESECRISGSELLARPRTEWLVLPAPDPVVLGEDLRDLPVVFGPVFAAQLSWATVSPGAELVEAKRIEVCLKPAAGPVIWSTSARRLSGNAAVFPPGSRFRVLNAEPGRLMLLDLAGGRQEVDDGRLAQRMLQAFSGKG